MNLKEKCRFLGLGCYGGKQTKEFITLGYKGDAANGSEQDLKALGDIPKYRLQGFDGFGGHRERALDCLAQNSEFMKYVDNIKEEIVFILFGGGGSTGSGCATILAEMLLQKQNEEDATKKIVCPVIAMPSSDEPIAKHRNAYQAVQELQEIDGLGATFFINNNIDKDYIKINSTFTKFLDTFLTSDSYGELNNFDESERLEMLRDSGMMVISLMGVKEKDQTLDHALMLSKLSKNGIFAPIEDNKICENIAIIHSGKNNSDIEKNSVIAEVGKPKNVNIDTSNILFICGGAFDGLEKIVYKDSDNKPIGFNADIKDIHTKNTLDLSDVQQKDLNSFGLIPELIGRLPIITTLQPLSEEDLVRILVEPKNALTKQYKELLAMDNVKLEFDETALKKIAELANSKNIGARGLRSIIEKAMKNVMYTIPDLSEAKKVIITSGVIEGTEEAVIYGTRNKKIA